MFYLKKRSPMKEDTTRNNGIGMSNSVILKKQVYSSYSTHHHIALTPALRNSTVRENAFRYTTSKKTGDKKVRWRNTNEIIHVTTSGNPPSPPPLQRQRSMPTETSGVFPQIKRSSSGGLMMRKTHTDERMEKSRARARYLTELLEQSTLRDTDLHKISDGKGNDANDTISTTNSAGNRFHKSDNSTKRQEQHATMNNNNHSQVRKVNKSINNYCDDSLLGDSSPTSVARDPTGKMVWHGIKPDEVDKCGDLKYSNSGFFPKVVGERDPIHAAILAAKIAAEKTENPANFNIILNDEMPSKHLPELHPQFNSKPKPDGGETHTTGDKEVETRNIVKSRSWGSGRKTGRQMKDSISYDHVLC